MEMSLVKELLWSRHDGRREQEKLNSKVLRAATLVLWYPKMMGKGATSFTRTDNYLRRGSKKNTEFVCCEFLYPILDRTVCIQ
jgi:hypothetical protein